MHKEVGRSCQSRAPRIGHTRHTCWSSANDSERRQLVSQEMRKAEEEKRIATAVGQVKKGAWTKWVSAEQRNISWSVLWEFEYNSYGDLHTICSLLLQNSVLGMMISRTAVSTTHPELMLIMFIQRFLYMTSLQPWQRPQSGSWCSGGENSESTFVRWL